MVTSLFHVLIGRFSILCCFALINHVVWATRGSVDTSVYWSLSPELWVINTAYNLRQAISFNKPQLRTCKDTGFLMDSIAETRRSCTVIIFMTLPHLRARVLNRF